MAKPAYNLDAGKYRVLGERRDNPLGIALGPGVEIAKPAAAEWYDRRILGRTTVTQHVKGRKRPRVITQKDEFELTVGAVVGVGAVLLGWEVGQSIAHGLAGVDPLTWASDIDNWLTGKSSSPPAVSTATLGGRLQSAILGAVAPAPAPVTQTGGGGSSTTPGASGGGSSGGSGSTAPSPLEQFEQRLINAWRTQIPVA